MVGFSATRDGKTYGVTELSCRGFWVITSDDIAALRRSFGDECTFEPLGGKKYYFEFVMPFHTVGEASIRLRNILTKAGYRVPKD